MFNFETHTYTVATIGAKVKAKSFSSRQAANNYMYDQIGRLGLQIEEVYDDKHFKTYICSNGVRFFVGRE